MRGAENLAVSNLSTTARTLCTTRVSRAFYYNKKDFDAKSTDDFVKDWQYNSGGKNHPLWWKLWVGGAASLFLYEHLYEYTKPVKIIFPPNYGAGGDGEGGEDEDEDGGEDEDGDGGDDDGGAEEAEAAPAAADDDAPADDAPADDEAPAAEAPADDEAPADTEAPADAPADAEAPADEDDDADGGAPEDPKAED